MSPLALRLLFGVLELPIAYALGFAIYFGTYAAGCRITACVDIQGLPWLIVGLLAAIILGIGYWIGAMRLKTRWRIRIALDLVALIAVLLAYVLPQIEASRAAAAQRAAVAAADERSARDRLAWIDSLRARADAHGPVGQMPPRFEVDDDGVTVRITNLAAKARPSVSVARVRADPGAPGGWRGCALYGDNGGRLYHRQSLAPRETKVLRADPRCAEEFAGAPLEYRIGDDVHQEGWWSDSAFAAAQGREREGFLFVTPPRWSDRTATPAAPHEAPSTPP